MTAKIKVLSKYELQNVIFEEIRTKGHDCDLNHIDVSMILDMKRLFCGYNFNGDISGWNVCSVQDMSEMFCEEDFNGDISNWNVSNVKQMSKMFMDSSFNGDISKWNVSKVKDMSNMFTNSKFTGDLTDWEPYNLSNANNVFRNCSATIPYWMDYEGIEERNRAINAYQLNKKLNLELSENSNSKKRTKI